MDYKRLSFSGDGYPLPSATAGKRKTFAFGVETVKNRTSSPVGRYCPYCGNSYKAVVPDTGVTQCPQCKELHIFSGVRDVEKYGGFSDTGIRRINKDSLYDWEKS